MVKNQLKIVIKKRLIKMQVYLDLKIVFLIIMNNIKI